MSDMCKCGHERDLHINGFGACIATLPFCRCTHLEYVGLNLKDLGQRKIYRF